MNNNNNELERWAREKIRRDQKCKPQCCVIVGPTGPTGPSGGPTGPTHTLFSESKWYFLTIFLI